VWWTERKVLNRKCGGMYGLVDERKIGILRVKTGGPERNVLYRKCGSIYGLVH
jgi:hypothetical protein